MRPPLSEQALALPAPPSTPPAQALAPPAQAQALAPPTRALALSAQALALPVQPHGATRAVAPAVAAACPPGTFTGAVLPVCGVEVLIVVVRPWVLADVHEANLYVVAFYERFRRTIVLMAQRPDGAPCFYGPADIVRVLHGLPFEMLPWRRWLFRTAPPPSWQLPIPEPRGGAVPTERATAPASAYSDSAAGRVAGIRSAYAASSAVRTVELGRPRHPRPPRHPGPSTAALTTSP